MGRVQSEHASDPLRVHSSVNFRKINALLIVRFISIYSLLKNYQGDHIYKQMENLHKVLGFGPASMMS